MGKYEYTKKDAASDTDSSTSEVSRAWHDARDDAMESGDLPERESSKSGDSGSDKDSKK